MGNDVKSKYEYKLVKPEGMRRNLGWGFIDKLNLQITKEAESGWDYYRETPDMVLVFRRPRP